MLFLSKNKRVDDNSLHKLQQDYSLVVTKNDIEEDAYDFPIPPTDISSREQFAVNIQPMIGVSPGYFVELEGGCSVKTVSIRGTTGFKPKQSIYEKNAGRGLIPDQYRSKTGLQYFISLENFIHNYQSLLISARDNDEDINNIKMHLIDFKYGRQYIVHLMGFNYEQTSRNPLVIYYSLEFQVIGESKIKYKTEPVIYGHNTDQYNSYMSTWKQNVITAVTSTANLISKISLNSRNVMNNLTFPLNNIDNVLNSSLQSIKVIDKYAKYTTSKVINNINAISRALQDAKDAGDTDITITNNEIATYSYNFNTMYENSVFDSLHDQEILLNNNVANGSYQAQKQNIAILDNGYLELIDTIIDAYKVIDSPIAIEDVSQRLDSYKDGLDIILTNNVQYINTDVTIDYNLEVLDALNRTTDQYTKKSEPLNILSGKYKKVKINSIDTPFSLAQTHLNDWTRYNDIIILNNLEYPYFTGDGRGNTIAYGDYILVPTITDITITDLSHLNNIIKTHDLLTLSDTYLGFDMRLQNKNLVTNSRLDLDVISGLDALCQGISLMLDTLQGARVMIPLYGNPITVGEKVKSVGTMQLYSDYIKKIILQDDRVTDVPLITISFEDNMMRLYIELYVKNLNEIVIMES